MGAFSRLPAPEGAAAMNAINVVIINPWFFTAFFGTALLSLALVVAGLIQGGQAGLLAAGGGMVFFAGVIGVTMAVNVPLNNALAAASAGSEAQAALWQRYLDVWTAWNHGRTMASLVALALFALAFRAA